MARTRHIRLLQRHCARNRNRGYLLEQKVMCIDKSFKSQSNKQYNNWMIILKTCITIYGIVMIQTGLLAYWRSIPLWTAILTSNNTVEYFYLFTTQLSTFWYHVIFVVSSGIIIEIIRQIPLKINTVVHMVWTITETISPNESVVVVPNGFETVDLHWIIQDTL